MQWYEKNPRLYQLEKKLMNQRFPNAKEVKLSNGNLAWQIKMNISQTDAFAPWTFLLIYKSDHPNNNSYGGSSVDVIPLVPNFEQLQARVKEAKGKYFSEIPPVPRIKKTYYGERVITLCTRVPFKEDYDPNTVNTAVQFAAWAAEWALYFELSMRDNRVWNKWIENSRFKRWKIAEPEAETKQSESVELSVQWYEKNPQLYETEKARMFAKYPQAKETKLADGNLAWEITMKLNDNNDFEPWTFLLVYKSDFSENSGRNSINVIPLNPTYEQLKKRLEVAMEGQDISVSGVPHCTQTTEGVTHLSVRKPGDDLEQSAVSYVSAAAEWALYFELSMRDTNIWNKWINNDYFNSGR